MAQASSISALFKILLTFFVVFTVSFGSTLASEKLKNFTETKMNPLSCKLMALNNQTLGRAIKLTFQLQNNTDEGLYVLTWQTPFEGILGDIFSIEYEGKLLSYQGPMFKRGEPVEEEYLKLEAGQMESINFELQRSYHFSKPGEYLIHYRGRIHDLIPASANIPGTREQFHPQSLKCDPVSLHLKSPDEFPR